MLSMATAALFVASCSGTAETAAHHNFVLVGSTPCDAAIKAALGIAAETKCDFIRWNIAMDPTKGNAYKLDADYGESQPNTLGFVAGGQNISASGKFEVASQKVTHLILREQPTSQQRADTPPKQGAAREVYRLKSEQPAIDVSFVRLNTNLFHLLMPDGTMMIGNGGWSYTLNRSVPIANAGLPSVSLAARSEAPLQPTAVFDGRTPCREITELNGIAVRAADCFKLKWRLTLNRAAATFEPTTFTIQSTFAREKPVTGKWSIVKTGDATIYRLEPDASMKPVSLLLAEDNLLFFLDSNGKPLVGNKDFSFTLNRRL
jgi:hypothetical protein